MNPYLKAMPWLRRSAHLELAPLVTAPGCGRRFVRHLCGEWNIDDDKAEMAELLASELTSNAVQATGIIEPRPEYAVACAEARLIGVRLLEFEQSLVIEVWDTSFEPPKPVEADADAEHGRGLQLVEALSLRWGYYYVRTGGKVVWCELALRPDPPADGWDRDSATLQRVLEALQVLVWGAPS